MGSYAYAKLCYGVPLADDTSDEIIDHLLGQDDDWDEDQGEDGDEDQDETPIVSLISHGNEYNEYHVIAITSTVMEIHMGGILTPVLDTPADADKCLRDFCAHHGLPYDQPRWMLIAEYR